jgi:two-component system, LuxR family, sensor histidine kinase DctS
MRGRGGLALAQQDEAWVADPAAGAGPSVRRDLLSIIPLLAIAALVVLVGSLVWIVSRDRAETARTQLATDALWVEQTLRFQLSVDEDTLARLALEAAGGTAPEVLDSRARLHVANNPEVLSIAWSNADGQLLRAVPARPKGAVSPATADLFLRASTNSARPVYGPVTPGSPTTVTLGVRTADGAALVTATVSLSMMLDRHIPWWIAEKYAVELVSPQGDVLAARARAAREPEGNQHSISFDPPLHDAMLRISPYKSASSLGNVLLLAAIAALSAFAILALGVLHRSTLRRRRAELRLRGEMAFRRSMEESLTVGLRAKDHEGRVLYVNSAFCTLVGWPSETLMGHKAPMPYWAPERLEETLARQQALASGGARAQSFETRFRHRDGHEIDVQVYEAPLIDAKGAHHGWMGSVIDITEAKRAAKLAREQEDTMARTGRLVTLGEMASTLAHELNQPLSAIASYAAGALNLLAQPQADPTLLRPALEKLAVQAGRAGQIIRRIQDFVKKREPRFTEVLLGEVVSETLGFLAADARENHIRLEAALEEVPAVLADRILLEQVLINLIRNGMEAMADRSGQTVHVSLRTQEGGFAVIEVCDQGGGIAPEVAGRLFDAFTSTKAQGMGMGLNICRSIIELHRGQLTHFPNPLGGTVFRVVLPFAAQGMKAAE